MVSYKELGLVNSRGLFKKKLLMADMLSPPLLISTTWNNCRPLYLLVLKPSPPL